MRERESNVMRVAELYIRVTNVLNAKLYVYYAGLESLPSELQRNFHHMRDLDQQAQDLMRNIDKV